MLNMDFSQRLVIKTHQQDWIAIPAAGVWRKPLEREAKESGHTTSVVKYEPNSKFATHPHPYGEEILVLEGCVILVKLNQFAPNDLETVRINANQAEWLAGIGGLKVMPLHNFGHEHVALVKWPKGEKFQPHRHFGGEEIFVLSGEFKDEFGEYPTYTWLRCPHKLLNS